MTGPALDGGAAVPIRLGGAIDGGRGAASAAGAAGRLTALPARPADVLGRADGGRDILDGLIVRAIVLEGTKGEKVQIGVR